MKLSYKQIGLTVTTFGRNGGSIGAKIMFQWNSMMYLRSESGLVHYLPGFAICKCLCS